MARPTRNGAHTERKGFAALLYRYFFYAWLFRDLTQARDGVERQTFLRHNQAMGAYLPAYLWRWSCVAGFCLLAGWLCERWWQAPTVAALFLVAAVVTVPIMVLTLVAWLFLGRHDGR